MNKIETELARLKTGADLSAAAAIAATQLAAVPAARAFHSAAQSIPNGTLTVLALNSERFDTDTIHDTVTSNSRLTCKTAGVYQISATVEFAISAVGVTRQVNFLLNGATFIARQDTPPITGGGIPTHVAVSTLYQLAVTDYVEIQVYQDSGGALNVNSGSNYSPEFTMVRVSA